jgi:hypothetical protein
MVITIDYEWKDNRTGQVLLARTSFTSAEPFAPARGVADRIEAGQNAAIAELARDVVESLRSNWEHRGGLPSFGGAGHGRTRVVTGRIHMRELSSDGGRGTKRQHNAERLPEDREEIPETRGRRDADRDGRGRRGA